MTTFVNAAALAGLLAVGSAMVATHSKAAPRNDAVREGQGVITALSANASATTYWVKEAGWAKEAGGLDVVTTVDTVTGQDHEAETHAVVRFESVLLPGQSQVISVPVAIGERQQVLRIRRFGDQIEVQQIIGST